MMDQELWDFHQKRLEELPLTMREKALTIIHDVLDSSPVADDIKKFFSENKFSWWALHHLNWGMWMRNKLRNGGISDQELPSGNWDDYYVPLVELAFGLRKL